MDLKIFLFRKVSTMTGIIILVLITLVVSMMILGSLKQVVSVRVETISSLGE